MASNTSLENHPKKKSREFLKIFSPAIIITLIGFVVVYQFVDPAPPDHLSIGTGSQTGAYYPFGQQYRKSLARDGISLEVSETDPIEKLNTNLMELKKIDEEVKHVTVPLSYAAELYALRIHIVHV